MNSNKLRVFILFTSALVLSACGGANSNHTSNAAFQGVFDNGNDIVATDSYSLSILMLNGKNVTLAIPNKHPAGITVLPNGITIDGKVYNTFTVSGSKYTDSKFGYIINENTDKQGVTFSQGELTLDMPSDGNVVYYGDSVYVDSKSRKVSTGDTYLFADFSNKQIRGYFKNTIEPDDQYNIAFSGKISSNTFRNNTEGNTEVTGYFYGAQANEAGGIFKDKNGSYKGAFGAFKAKGLY